MENLVIPATLSTPRIEFNRDTGVLEIQGESYPENSLAFYDPLLDWIAAYLEQAAGPLVLNVNLSYLNTSSVKCMMDILERLEQAHRDGRPVTLNWYYDEENDRALDIAEEFREEVTLPFNVIAVAGAE